MKRLRKLLPLATIFLLILVISACNPKKSSPPITFELETAALGSGTVTHEPEGTSFESGTEVTLTATPETGWTFQNWTGDLTGTVNPATITMDADKSVTAVFTETATETVELTLDTTGQGTVTATPEPQSSASGVLTYAVGTEITLTATPDDGWTFQRWTGGVTSTDNPVALTLSGNLAVTALFTQPGELAFGVRDDVDPSSVQLSDEVVITGLETAAVSLSGEGSPELLVNGAVVATPAEVETGDILQVRLTAAEGFSETATASVTVGSETGNFAVTTRAAVPITIDFLSPPDSAAPGDTLDLFWTVTGDHDSLEFSSNAGDPSQSVFGDTELSVQAPTAQASVTYTLTAAHSQVAGSESETSITVQIPLWVCADSSDEIQIPDAALRAAMATELGFTFPLTCGEAQAVTMFGTGHSEAEMGTIESLVGMQHFSGLTAFDAQWNLVADLAPLANLTQLEHLNLDKNQVTDLSPLANLTALEFLSLWDNGPTRDAGADGITSSELVHLEGLTGLEELYLSENNIDSLSSLAPLAALRYLYAIGNNITDLTPLAGKTGLQALRLGFNQIAAAGPVASMDALVWLEINDNLLTDLPNLGGLEFLFSASFEGNFLPDAALASLEDNPDFPADAPLGLTSEPTDPTLNVSYNCLLDTAAVVADFLAKGVTAVVTGQRDDCSMGSTSLQRQLRLNQFREGGHIR